MPRRHVETAIYRRHVRTAATRCNSLLCNPTSSLCNRSKACRGFAQFTPCVSTMKKKKSTETLAKKNLLPVTITRADLVLSAIMVALYSWSATVSFKPALESSPPEMNAYSSAKPETASLKLKTTLAPYVWLEELVGDSVKYCSLRLLCSRRLLAAVCARVVFLVPDTLMMANVGGVMS